ncbi:collagen triple helix repeat-containing protein 1-like [Branchiostoma floridae x Branchiostoma japonicum]
MPAACWDLQASLEPMAFLEATEFPDLRDLAGWMARRGIGVYRGGRENLGRKERRESPGQEHRYPVLNIKQCAWQKLSDDRDHGKITECPFNKLSANSSLRVLWNGALRVTSTSGCCKRWYFTFNGMECSGPLPIEGLVFTNAGNGMNGLNIHRVSSIEGICSGVPKGPVNVELWVRNCEGISNSGNAYTGWNSVSRVIVEELMLPKNSDDMK